MEWGRWASSFSIESLNGLLAASAPTVRLAAIEPYHPAATRDCNRYQLKTVQELRVRDAGASAGGSSKCIRLMVERFSYALLSLDVHEGGRECGPVRTNSRSLRRSGVSLDWRVAWMLPIGVIQGNVCSSKIRV